MGSRPDTSASERWYDADPYSPIRCAHDPRTPVSLEPSTGKALLLTTSTEVSISPKLRAKTKTSKSGPDGKSISKPSANGAAPHNVPAPEKPKTPRPAKTFRLLPQRLAGNGTPLESHPDETLAFVSYNTLLSLYRQASPPQQLKGWRATVRRLAPPANPDKEGSPSSPTLQPATRVLIPNGDASSSPKATDGVDKSMSELLVVYSPDVPVPDGHVVMQPSCDNAEDWDLVRYVGGSSHICRDHATDVCVV